MKASSLKPAIQNIKPNVKNGANKKQNTNKSMTAITYHITFDLINSQGKHSTNAR